MRKSQIKGYDLSTDYEKLFELVQNGYRIPAWVVYSDEYDEPIYDLVEVKLQYDGDFWDICRRGYSYNNGKTLHEFESACYRIQLRWISPLI